MFSVKKFAAFCVVLVCILCFTSCKSKEPEETSGLNSTDLSFAVKNCSKRKNGRSADCYRQTDNRHDCGNRWLSIAIDFPVNLNPVVRRDKSLMQTFIL